MVDGMKLSVVGLRITGVVIFISSLQGVNSTSGGDNNTFGNVRMRFTGGPDEKKDRHLRRHPTRSLFRTKSFWTIVVNSHAQRVCYRISTTTTDMSSRRLRGLWSSFKGLTAQLLLSNRPRSTKEDITYHCIEGELDSHPSESPREATQILCSIITPINTVDPAQARLMIG